MTIASTQRSGARTTRRPRLLLRAFLGEFLADHPEVPVRTSVFLEALGGAGISVPNVRTSLDRLEQDGLIARRKAGRELEFTLTVSGVELLNEATPRVRDPEPFGHEGDTWTLVTFSVPEEQRTGRHRLRSLLTWNGFAAVRDGLWLAPGERDLATILAPLRAELPPEAVTAFAASELPGFPLAGTVRAAWDLDLIRAAHEAFLAEWDRPEALAQAGEMAVRTMLVADWLDLIRTDPGLPAEYMDDEWPAMRSYLLYRRLRTEIMPESDAVFASRIAR